jgi:hypothetical protein
MDEVDISKVAEINYNPNGQFRMMLITFYVKTNREKLVIK